MLACEVKQKHRIKYGYLRVSLTNECNHDCIFCHNEGQQKDLPEIIDTELMYRMIAAAKAIGNYKIKFTGGEPTIHTEIYSMIEKIKEQDHHIEIGIVTNGSNLTRDYDLLKKSSVDSITVSLFSVDEKVHERITKRNNLKIILEGLELLKKLDHIKLKINMVVFDENIGTLNKTINYFKERNYSYRILDVLDYKNDNYAITEKSLLEQLPSENLKGKKFHKKCSICEFKSNCGEADYLRLSVDNYLYPCLYRDDLKIKLDKDMSDLEIIEKLSIGYYRVHSDYEEL